MIVRAWKHAAMVALLFGMVGCSSGPRWDFWKVGKADKESNAELAEADLGPQFDSGRPSDAATPGASSFAAVPPGTNPPGYGATTSVADSRGATGWASEYDPGAFPGASPSAAVDVNNPYTQAIAGANAFSAGPSRMTAAQQSPVTASDPFATTSAAMSPAGAPATSQASASGAWNDPSTYSAPSAPATSYDFGAGAAASTQNAYAADVAPPAQAVDDPFAMPNTYASDPVAQAAATGPTSHVAAATSYPTPGYTQQTQAAPAAPAYVSGGTPGATGYNPGSLPNAPGGGTGEPAAADVYAQTAPTAQRRVDDAYRPGSTAFGDPSAWGGATFTAQNQPSYPQTSPAAAPATGYPQPSQGGGVIR